jgi:hypothetical protein
MDAVKAAAGMADLEHHGQDWNGLEFLTWLLGLEGDVESAVGTECRRAVLLADGHYTRVSRVLVMNPEMIAAVAFVQGATFAAAALGVEPER